MARFFKKRTENKGLPPGSLVFIGTKKVDNPSVEYISYNLETISESEFLKTKTFRGTIPKRINGIILRAWIM